MIVLALVLIGLIFGSFVNALVWRLHEQATIRDKQRTSKADKEELKRLSVAHGRSRCLSCDRELAVRDLLPVISWLWLRGKCRYCQAPIPDTPLAELAVPIFLVTSYLWWPWLLGSVMSWAIFAVWGLCIVAFTALLLYDLKWFLLPNRIVFPLIGLSLVFRVLLAIQADDWLGTLLGGLWGVLVLAGLFYALFVLSNEQWIGGGDVKLAIALGLLAGGPVMAMVLLFFASAGGTVAALPLAVRGKSVRGVRVPFGPFLIVATIATVLFGQLILDWYNGLFML